MSVGTSTGFLVYRGRTPWSWTKRLLSPWNYWKFFRRVLPAYPRRGRVLLMLLPLQFHPQSLYKISAQRVFPDKNRRLVKTSNPLDDFEVDRDRSSEIPQMGAVTVIQKGPSFDTSLVDQLPGPIYAINWLEKLDRQDVVYTSADSGYLRRFVAEEMFPILYMEINRIDSQGNYHARDAGHEIETLLDHPQVRRVAIHHKAGPQRPRTGMPATSGLAAVVALGFFAESITVYGWDFYLTFAPTRAGYWKTFFKYFGNVGIGTGAPFEQSVYNWHYAYRFSQLPNFKNHGYLSGLEKHKGINDRLDKIFYRLPTIDSPSGGTTPGGRVPPEAGV